MKKGISLIVLVITIIVMIIIAGAIIISLSQTNIVTQANKAVTDSDLANAQYAASLVYADALAANNDADATNNMTASDIESAINTALGTKAAKFSVSVDETTLKPTVTAAD